MNNIKFNNNIIFKLYTNLLSSYDLSEEILIYIFEFIVDYNTFDNHFDIIFEKKDRITKDLVFNKITLSKYNFVFYFTVCVLNKFFYLNRNIVIPYMRIDINYFINHLDNINYLENINKYNKILLLKLFFVIFYEFNNIENYYSIFYNLSYYNNINNLCIKLCKNSNKLELSRRS